MSRGKESSLRQQLIAARAHIIAQLGDLQWRPHSERISRWSGGSPDYRPVIAELAGQLAEIDALLGAEDKPEC